MQCFFLSSHSVLPISALLNAPYDMGHIFKTDFGIEKNSSVRVKLLPSLPDGVENADSSYRFFVQILLHLTSPSSHASSLASDIYLLNWDVNFWAL